MSLISDRLSISSSTGVKPKTVRFSLSYNFNLKNLFLDYVHQKDRSLYEELVCKLRDTGQEIKDDELLQLLKEARGCISILDCNLKLFVQVILLFKWNHRGDDVVKEYQAFLVELCSAHNFYASNVIDHLVSAFKISDENWSWEDGRPKEVDKRNFENLHLVIKALLHLIPMIRELLVSSLNRCSPYIKRPSCEHAAFFYNTLSIIDYEPSLKLQILNIVITKILSIDLNVSRSDIEHELVEEDIFNMETDDKVASADVGSRSSGPVASLDLSMLVMFSFFRSQCHDKKGLLQWDQTKSLYSHLLKVFESIVLPTHASNHIQFLLFYVVSLKETLCVNFLQVLWSKVINPRVAPVIRQAAVSYIASFLSRASFISIRLVEDCLVEMCTWVCNYIASQEGVTNLVIQDTRIHGVFYATCQAIFYIIAFSHKQLVSQDKGLVLLSSLNLPKMVSCKLNPLRACHPGVVSKFASVTRSYQLAYCYTVIERNSRACLPRLYLDSSGIESIVQVHLDTFFPFDPYTLPNSKKFVNGIYREYSEEMVTETDSKKDDDNEDDFLESTANKSLFSYSTSPGFIHYS